MKESNIQDKVDSVPTALTLKPLRGWTEIAERASAADGSVRGFLRIAKAYSGSDGRVYIKFPNDFARSMVERAGAKGNVLAAVNMNGQFAISENDLVFDIIDGKENISDLDEFDV